VLLDFVGGLLSTLQTVIDAGAGGDWAPIVGNPVKFGLGFVSVAYDLVFMAQHYCLYPHRGEQGRPAAGYARLRSQDIEEDELEA
jgi:cystinosin